MLGYIIQHAVRGGRGRIRTSVVLDHVDLPGLAGQPHPLLGGEAGAGEERGHPRGHLLVVRLAGERLLHEGAGLGGH